MSVRYRAHREAREPRVIDGVEILYAVALPPEKHGTWNGYSNHGCQCRPCKAAGAAYAAARPSTSTRPPFPRHVCALPRCRRKVPWPAGQCEQVYRRTLYCCVEHREAARAPREAKARAEAEAARERACACGCGAVFVPTRRRKLTATDSCAHRVAAQSKRAKRERSPLATRGTRGAEPGAARAGNRRAPRPVPPVAWRPPVPVVEPVRRSVPRPSFGLTRRSA